MKLEQSFEVAAPIERVWDALIDVQRVAPCLPGATVEHRNDDGSYDGSFTVKIGPTSASYAGKLQMEDVDAQAHRAVMQANGTDRRGQGSAKATIVSTVSPAGEDRTRVEVSTDYYITGRLARFGRGGMIEDISEKLLRQFAERLQQMLEAGGNGSGAAAVIEGETDAATAVEGETDAATAIEGETDAATAAGDDGKTAPATAAEDEPGAGAAIAATRPLPEPVAAEPVQGVTLVGSVLWERIRRNPIPAAFIVGLLLAFAVLGRRSRN